MHDTAFPGQTMELSVRQGPQGADDGAKTETGGPEGKTMELRLRVPQRARRWG